MFLKAAIVKRYRIRLLSPLVPTCYFPGTNIISLFHFTTNMSFSGFDSDDESDSETHGRELPVELTSCKSYFNFFDDYQYPYTAADEVEYPSASASYSSTEAEQSVVSLLDTDFLEIFDELAKDDEASVFGSSAAVAMPIVYALPAAELLSADSSTWAIQHATLIKGFESKELEQLSGRESCGYSMFRQIQNKHRSDAIHKWRGKKNKNVCKSTDKYVRSARQEATARRPRTHGKFKKVKAQWVAASEYFNSATGTTHIKLEDFHLLKSPCDIEPSDDITMV